MPYSIDTLLQPTGLWPLFPDMVIKGTMLLLLTFAAVVVLRRASAATRNFAWGLGLAILILLPLVPAVMPWRVGLLPPAAPRGAGAETALRSDRGGEPAVTPAIGVPETQSAQSAAGSATTSSPTDALPLLFTLWALGALIVVGRLGVGTIQARRLVGRARQVRDPEWADVLDAAALRLGIRRDVDLRVSGDVTMPITSGILRPVVVLPDGAADWQPDRREAVLLHELAHVRRHDIAWHFLVRLVAAAYWFHPLVWSALRRFRAESERACDDLVLACGTRASDYAQHLLDIVRGAGERRAPLAALPMAQRSDFEGRLLEILAPGRDRRGLAVGGSLAGLMLAGAIALPLAAIIPVRAERAEQVVLEGPSTSPGSMTGEPKTGASTNISTNTTLSVTTNTDVQVDASTSTGEPAPAQSPRLVPAGAMASLVTALRDSDAGVRRAVARSLGESGDSTVVGALSQALRTDADVEVRRSAAWALGQLEDARGVPALGEALRSDKDAEVRRKAAWALGQIENASAVGVLVEALEDSDGEVRRMAGWALGQIEDRSAVPGLITVLKDADPEARRMAAWALGQIEDPAAVQALGAALKDSNAEVRRSALHALGEIESPEAVSWLVPMLRDADAEVRKEAAWSLGQIESADAVAALVAALRDSNAEVRKTAAWALGQIESPQAAEGLATALADSDVGVRRSAAWALGQINDVHQAPKALIDALRDKDAKVREAAAHALREIADPAAVSALAAAIKDTEPAVRRAAIQALSEIRDPAALDMMVQALKDSDPEIRKAAARALGND